MRLFLFLLFLFCQYYTFGQKTEFIYTNSSLTKLTHLVDSINKEHKSSTHLKRYRSKYQARGHSIYMDKGRVRLAKKDIDKNISFEKFVSKYSTAIVRKDLLIIKSKKSNYFNEPIIYFMDHDKADIYHSPVAYEYNSKLYDKKLKGNWVYSYIRGDGLFKSTLVAYYILSEFESQVLPSKYAKMIQYVDRMVDTSRATIPVNSKFSVSIYASYDPLHMSVDQKRNYINELWNTLWSNKMSECRDIRGYSKRIAIISAEINQWESFLNAHLLLMFADIHQEKLGYGTENKNHYIDELEAININLTDLLLGSYLRLHEPSKNHFQTHEDLLAGLIAIMKNSGSIEDELLSMIKDSSLDDYNRIRIYLLYKKYINSLNDENSSNEKKSRLKEAVNELPDYLNSKFFLD